MKRHFCEPGPLPGKPLPYRAGCCSLSTQKHKTRDPFSEKSVVFYLHYPTLGSPMISHHDHLCLQATKYQPFPFTHVHVENQCKTLSVLVWVRTGKKKKGVVIPVLPPTQVGGETEKLSAGKTYSIMIGFLSDRLKYHEKQGSLFKIPGYTMIGAKFANYDLFHTKCDHLQK